MFYQYIFNAVILNSAADAMAFLRTESSRCLTSHIRHRFGYDMRFVVMARLKELARGHFRRISTTAEKRNKKKLSSAQSFADNFDVNSD